VQYHQQFIRQLEAFLSELELNAYMPKQAERTCTVAREDHQASG
jgi:hypothetical protein